MRAGPSSVRRSDGSVGVGPAANPRRVINAEAAILRPLLEQYERSVAFNTPAPWRRQMIVKVTEAQFPEAFAPDGADARAALVAAGVALANRGAITVVPIKGRSVCEPAEFRLAPEHVLRAYEIAEHHGFQPLAPALERVASHAAERVHEIPRDEVSWMTAYLESVATALPRGDATPLGIQDRARLKEDVTGWCDALSAAAHIALGVSGWERQISERIFRDSKRLGTIRGRVEAVLRLADPQWSGLSSEECGDVLAAYGVRQRSGIIACAGAVPVRIGNVEYRLSDFVPTALLPEAWGPALVKGIVDAGIQIVTTIENEYPYFAYVEEAGGPEQLQRRRELVIYTAGFPTPALTNLLAAAAAASPSLQFRHWGDADVGGLRIWWLLQKRIGRPVHFFRTTADWARAAFANREGRPLTPADRLQLAAFRRLVHTTGSDVASTHDALALVDVLEAAGMKLEQERY